MYIIFCLLILFVWFFSILKSKKKIYIAKCISLFFIFIDMLRKETPTPT